MDMMIDLNVDTVMIYAIKAYDKPNFIKSELKEDLKHLSYVRRLFRRYQQYGELRERLILNHLVILYNIFGVPAATRLLFYHVRVEDYAILKTFLIFLNYMPDIVTGIRGYNIHSDDLQVDQTIVDVLRRVKV
jgi:hypothetical protein